MSNILNPVFPIGIPDIVQTGTITAQGGVVSVPSTGNGQNEFLVVFTGTFSSGTTVTFEGSIDNTNFFPLNARNLPTGSIGMTVSGGASTAVKGSLSGFQYFRVRCTAFTTNDSISVNIVLSVATHDVALNNPLPTGSNTIGNVGSMGMYNTTLPTLTNGQVSSLQQTINGFLKSSLADLLAGEDLTANVLKVEQRFNSTHFSGSQSNVLVKATPGYVAGILIGIQGTGSSIITIADDTVTTNIATIVANIDTNQATGNKGFVPLYRIFSTAITVSSTGTTYPDFTVIYR